MRPLPRTLLAIAALSAATGCLDFGGGGGGGCSGLGSANGLAGKGSFDYACASQADPGCDDRGLALGASKLPPAVALGARFGLVMYGDGAPVVEPVSERAVQREGRAFVARRAGHVGFVVSRAGEAIDAIRLLVVAPTGVAISLADEPAAHAPEIRLTADFGPSTRDVRAFATDGARALAGTIDVLWSIDDPTVASLSLDPDGTCRLAAEARGETWLRARSGALSASTRVVVGTVHAPSDAGSDQDGDAGADAADAADAGADS